MMVTKTLNHGVILFVSFGGYSDELYIQTNLMIVDAVTKLLCS